jgi:raffinose synthase
MANFQNCVNWCRPYFGIDISKIPNNTQALLYQKKDGKYGFILPIVDEIYKATLRGSEAGMEVCLMSNCDSLNSCETLAFICGEGDEPYKLMNDCARLSMKLLNNGASVRSERRYPEIFEHLGWCSWDAMEIRVSTAGLVEKCEEIKQKNIPIKWAIIDDMWAECDKLRDIPDDLTRETGMFKVMHSSKLRSFEADPKRFPAGLRDCIEKMKSYGLKIGMWHPIGGYWSGIDPDSELSKKYADLFITLPDGLLIPSIELDKLYTFYNEFHTFLKECGADFVKIDNQGSIINRYKNICPIGKAARTVQRAISSSVGANFDNDIINCMGMANENMFNRPAGMVSRCSGDFQPENRAWFIRHILACSYNSLIQGMFYQSDWDMWWTDDEQAKKNSVLRAISGGPIYVSDKIGRTRPEILEPLCYSDGRILRCADPAVPTVDCLVTDPETSGKIFKVRNTYNRSGVIAAFNLDKENKPVTGQISALDIGMDFDEYAVYEHFSGEVSIIHAGESLDVTLYDHDDFRLYTIVPFSDGIAVLGLIDKFNSPLAVLSGFAGVYTLYEGGKFAFISADDKAFTVTSESGTYIPEKNGVLYTVDLPIADCHVKIGS